MQIKNPASTSMRRRIAPHRMGGEAERQGWPFGIALVSQRGDWPVFQQWTTLRKLTGIPLGFDTLVIPANQKEIVHHSLRVFGLSSYTDNSTSLWLGPSSHQSSYTRPDIQSLCNHREYYVRFGNAKQY